MEHCKSQFMAKLSKNYVIYVEWSKAIFELLILEVCSMCRLLTGTMRGSISNLEL